MVISKLLFSAINGKLVWIWLKNPFFETRKVWDLNIKIQHYRMKHEM